MLNGLLRVYKDYQIVLKPINTDFATNAIEYCFEDFPNIYHTFGHTRATFIPFTEKRRPPGQPQGNSKQT